MDEFQVHEMRFWDHDRSPFAPHLSVEADPDACLSLEEQNCIFLTLYRGIDNDVRACILTWDIDFNAFGPTGFILLHHPADGKKKLCPMPSKVPSTVSITLDPWNCHKVINILPGQKIKFAVSLPDSFWRIFIPGERYELFWPGQEIALWGWGDISENMGTTLKRDIKRPHLVIPGGACCSISVIREARTFSPPPSPPLTRPSDRVATAPVVSVALDCPPTLTVHSQLQITVQATYCRVFNADTVIPYSIMFNTIALTQPHNFSIYRRSRENKNVWQRAEFDFGAGVSMIFDDPDEKVNVSRHKDFSTISTQQCWTCVDLCHYDTLPADTVVGDVYRYTYRGGTVDWWDWGDTEMHKETIVSLPCWVKGDVTDPPDNEGRPALILPASNTVEFTIVD